VTESRVDSTVVESIVEPVVMESRVENGNENGNGIEIETAEVQQPSLKRKDPQDEQDMSVDDKTGVVIPEEEHDKKRHCHLHHQLVEPQQQQQPQVLVD